MKGDHNTEAKKIFQDMGDNITKEGKRYLGAALGDREFVNEDVKQRVLEWERQINRLADTAESQPQSAYAAFRHSVAG